MRPRIDATKDRCQVFRLSPRGRAPALTTITEFTVRLNALTGVAVVDEESNALAPLPQPQQFRIYSVVGEAR